MDRFERRKERSKEDIRKAAEELFSRFGTTRVSINDIADRAGVSQATVYNNFGTKEALVEDYRKTMVNRIADRFRDILVWKQSYFDKMSGFFQSWIDLADRYRLETGKGRENSGYDRPSELFSEEIEKALARFINEGKEQGQVSPELSNEAVICYMKFIQEGITHHPEIKERLDRDPGLRREMLDLFIYGVSGRTGKSG